MRNLKKIIALVAVFAMMVSTVAFAQTFTDVADEHNYYEAIEMLSKLEILTGDDQDGDGKMDFRPEDTITRAEVAAIVSRIQNIDSAAQRATEFVDVPATHWASGYVAQAAGQGIVNGYGDGNFGPEDNVLYEQVIKMLMVTLGYEPFAADNGGYPSGYLTAASRYGVTEGLIGAHVGEEATRGQVAQMVYKAVDTALMDRYVYGDEKEYVIYDGVNRSYMSLLTRDLGVKKGSGIVKENGVTTLTSGKSIDTDEPVEIDFIFDGYYVYDDEVSYDGDYNNYKLWEVNTIYEADSNASDYIGKHVQFFLKEANRKGDYNLISVAPTNKNKEVSFGLGEYAGYAAGEVEFYTSVSKKTSVDIETGAALSVIYNGVAYDAYETAEDTYTIANVFSNSPSDEGSALVTPKSTYSGEITFIDNDKDAEYDVVSIEIASIGVVDEVSDFGLITMQSVPTGYFGTGISLEFDEEDNEQIIKLTKDGEEIEYTELKEWDVLAIYYAEIENTEYYDVRVLESSAVTSSVTGSKGSDTSADGSAYLIDGTYYDVANGCYNDEKIKIGAAGTFYIDAYDKIVAYDKNGANVASDNYAYILGAEETDADQSWGVANVRVLALDKTGEVYDMQFASSVQFVNVPSGVVAAEAVADEQIKIKDIADYLDTLAAHLVGELVTYEANSAGEIKSITFAQNSDEEDGTLYRSGIATNASYDEDEAELKVSGNTYTLTEDTVVFFINTVIDNGLDVAVYGETAVDKSEAKVGTFASIAENDGTLDAVVFDGQDDVPGAVVLLNTNGGISAKANIAVLAEDTGVAYVDGDKVTSVSYYMGGELCYSTVDADLGLNHAGLGSAVKGDVYKFTLSADGSVIELATAYLAGVAERTNFKAPGAAGAMTVATVTGEEVGPYDEDIFFGPVAKVDTGSSRIRVATYVDETDNDTFDGVWDFTSLDSIKVNDGNVYVVDMNRVKNEVYVGTIASAYADDRVLDKNLDGTFIEINETGTVVADDEFALGMMDYVYAVEYDDVVDVVVYKAYDFGRFKVSETDPDAE